MNVWYRQHLVVSCSSLTDRSCELPLVGIQSHPGTQAMLLCIWPRPLSRGD
uniref:Uncharacterized protein n=1 Tax=Anguilla anguilla TaxID=7936 RepID=A0A0E9R942_ANGAN